MKARHKTTIRHAHSRDRDGTFDARGKPPACVVPSDPCRDSITCEDQEEVRAIIRGLNLHGPRHVRAFDDVA